jgi:tripartite-type tricarboxylate transporter receptor subunit TctC
MTARSVNLPAQGLALGLLVGALAWLPNAGAQEYPTKPIRLVITYPPGGNTDLVGRALALKLGEFMGQQVVVDNRGGAGGVLGSMITAQSAPDGYTIMLGTSAGMVINPLLSRKLTYDPVRDFAPVSMVVIVPQLLVINPQLPVKNVRELIAFAKAKPGYLNAGSSGVGTPNHFGTELLKWLAGVDIVHVPYKGGAPCADGPARRPDPDGVQQRARGASAHQGRPPRCARRRQREALAGTAEHSNHRRSRRAGL